MLNNVNVLLSDRQSVQAVINPVSQAAATVSTGWISLANLKALQAIIFAGVLGASATLDAKFQQATDNTGTGAKDVSGKAITQLVKATDDNKGAVINLRADELDVNNNFAFARLSITVGTATSLIAAIVLGADGRYQPVAPAAAVKQVVA
jgi:hypothetical protein